MQPGNSKTQQNQFSHTRKPYAQYKKVPRELFYPVVSLFNNASSATWAMTVQLVDWVIMECMIRHGQLFSHHEPCPNEIQIPSSLPPSKSHKFFPINLLNPTDHVMHQQFNIQQLYILPTLYLYVLYLSENKQWLVPLIS